MSRAVPGGRGFLREVLARYGITHATIHDIRSGRMNKHWRVAADDATYALRRYTPRRSAAAIQYEHEVLAHTARLDWPVAAPLAAAGGATTVDVDGRHYALFPFLLGRPAPYAHARYLRFKGGLLARLHRALDSCPVAGQREGFGHLWELDALTWDGPYESFAALLEAFGREQPTQASAIRTLHEESDRALAEHAAHTAPTNLIHFDFHHDNILFVRGRLTALLDFDLVHRDVRASDLAASIGLDCLRAPAYDEIDPAAARAFLAGYLAETRLGDAELRLIVPLIRAWWLWGVNFRLLQWVDGSNPKALRSIARTLNARFPGLDRMEGEINAAIAAAVEDSDEGGR